MHLMLLLCLSDRKNPNQYGCCCHKKISCAYSFVVGWKESRSQYGPYHYGQTSSHA